MSDTVYVCVSVGMVVSMMCGSEWRQYMAKHIGYFQKFQILNFF